MQLISTYHLLGRICSALPPSSCSETPANHTHSENLLACLIRTLIAPAWSLALIKAPLPPLPPLLLGATRGQFLKGWASSLLYHLRLHTWDLTTVPPTPSLLSDPSPFPHHPHSRRFLLLLALHPLPFSFKELLPSHSQSTQSDPNRPWLQRQTNSALGDTEIVKDGQTTQVIINIAKTGQWSLPVGFCQSC